MSEPHNPTSPHAPTPHTSAEVLCVHNLTLSSVSSPYNSSPEAGEGAKSCLLYRDVNLSAQRGDIVLLLGASGSGKSLLMNLLIGKVSRTSESLMISSEASVKMWGQELLNERYPSALEGELGVLFQGLGLLEDLTARDNLRFAYEHSAHAGSSAEGRAQLAQLAQDLGLTEHLDRPVSALSGGQRQRVALARLLAYRSRAMLFDEPTSALDPLSSERVVQMIQEAHERADSELTLIITHDYASFLPIADQVWVVQPDRTIRVDQPARAPHDYLELLKQPAAASVSELSDEAWLEHAAQQRDRQLKGRIKATPHRLARLAQPLTHPRQALWAARYGAHLFKEVVVRGLPFHLIAGMIVGMITTYFTFNTHMGTVALERLVELQGAGEGSRELVEVSRFVLPTFFKEMLAGFSAAMYRALIPLFTCVCVAARGGTAATAYLSGMRDPSRHEWDALTAFGVSPRAFFGVQLIVTFSIGCALLSLFSFISASFGSLLTSLWTNPLCDLNLWWGAFVGGLKLKWGLWPAGSAALALKTALSGACIALVALFYGSRARAHPQEVMSNLASSNVLSVLLTLVVFFVILVLETR